MFPQWQWQILSLPPRHFSWRVRGNPLFWSIAERATLEQNYDALLATSMVDLATLRGLVPKLSQIPSILYFHENQFDYPQQSKGHGLLEAQMVSLYSAMAADVLAFNSAYNRTGFLQGCSALLSKFPDKVPAGLVASLEQKSRVLPVPLRAKSDTSVARWPGAQGDVSQRPPRLLWVGRFEHDKGGEGLYHLLQVLRSEGQVFELAIIGQQFRNSPSVFSAMRREFESEIVAFGFVEDEADYEAILAGADIVIATATHEFQGLAVLQAVRSGCLPVVPDRLAYSEIYPRPNRYVSDLHNPEIEAASAASLVQKKIQCLHEGEAKTFDVSAFECSALEPGYRRLFACALDAAG